MIKLGSRGRKKNDMCHGKRGGKYLLVIYNRVALNYLEEITNDDLLGNIFANFGIGK